MPEPTYDDIDVDSLVDSINLDIDGLLELDRDELAALLAHIANEARITTTMFKKARIELPSFSLAKWSKFAEQYGLPQDVSALKLEPFKTPRYCLPLSLQEAMFENAWRWQDVYREKADHTKEKSRVRILDPYIVPIVALFQGRVIDEPVMKTEYGGEVGHEIFTIAGVLFFVIELKRDVPDENGLAQLFFELLSAAEMNKSDVVQGLRVYGLLTDLTQFKFYSYDPATKQFCFDETIFSINANRIEAFSDMMDVSNKIFGVVLSGYMDTLRAWITKDEDRANHNQTGRNIPSSSQKPSELTGEGKSTGSRSRRLPDYRYWEAALVLAEDCCAKFKEPATSLPDIEEKANEALGLLAKSVRSIPRASIFTGRQEYDPAELKALATRVVKETYECYL
ncbi:hypothetical protein M378DRAFT_170927 [Amanita muscaria Koide BX008]|uniref:Uncharacterized protein n=1 Tax=Amanita muscaria (strain Koide BX008) TaxID=946122 RepID=A0A0C2WA79_AMAMK|nr:hypothetical protein M378DRAFT_170927 [Amanita muscaria Koide BX008]